MNDRGREVFVAKARIASALVSLLAEMKRADFSKNPQAESIEDAFDKLASALRLLNGGVP